MPEFVVSRGFGDLLLKLDFDSPTVLLVDKKRERLPTPQSLFVGTGWGFTEYLTINS